MKFMEKAKRFFTLKRRANDGFTLVELIVVIAILAILAGVAVPAYSGYIKKAEKAGDMQLLGAINEAYQAACMAEGVDIKTLTPATAKINLGAGKIVSVVPGELQESFDMFYQGNQDTAFKVVEALVFDPAYSSFVEAVGAIVTVGYGGGSLKVNMQDVSNFENSAFGQVGVETILTQLDDVTDIAAGMSDGALGYVHATDGFLNSALASMGMSEADYADMDKAAKGQLLYAQRDKLAKEMVEKSGLKEGDAGYEEAYAAAQNKVTANATVLYTAQQTAGMSKDAAMNLISTADKQSIINKMKDEKTAGEGISQAALICGLYTAYINTNEDTSNPEKTIDAITVLNALQDEDSGFNAYLNSPEMSTDLDGYLSSLNIINSSTSDVNATEHLMVNGFNNSDLSGAINGLLGQQ